MATKSQLNSVAFPEMRAVGEEGVVLVGVIEVVAETTVEIAEAVVEEGVDHPEIVECPHPEIEEGVTMTDIVMTTVVVDIAVLLRLVVSLLLQVGDFIPVQTAMGNILLPLMVQTVVLMDLLPLGDLVDLVLPLLV